MKKLLALLVLLTSLAAQASYDLDGSGDRFDGDFGVGNESGYPVTLGIWIKYTDFPLANRHALQFGNIAATNSDYHSCIFNGGIADGRFGASSFDGSSNPVAVFTLANPASLDNTWFPLVCIFRGDTDRQIHVDTRTNTGTNSSSSAVTQTLRYLSAGGALSGGGLFTGKIAEIAVWEAALSNADIDAFMSGTAASGINTANLKGYWSLSTNDITPDDESGNGGPTLSATGNPTFDADHPAITSGGTDLTLIRRRR